MNVLLKELVMKTQTAQTPQGRLHVHAIQDLKETEECVKVFTF